MEITLDDAKRFYENPISHISEKEVMSSEQQIELEL